MPPSEISLPLEWNDWVSLGGIVAIVLLGLAGVVVVAWQHREG